MKPGDLVKYGEALGVLVRKLQWDEFEEDEQEAYFNWDGAPAWWIHWFAHNKHKWNYEDELTLVKKGN